MKDRYLFKAKGQTDDKWHIGLLVNLQENKCIIHESDRFEWICDSETLCQCTGLKDKNRTLIWENDIVRHYNDRDKPEQYDIGIICWNEEYARYERSSEYGNKNYIIDRKCKYEVIGNIFDNPELLEVE